MPKVVPFRKKRRSGRGLGLLSGYTSISVILGFLLVDSGYLTNLQQATNTNFNGKTIRVTTPNSLRQPGNAVHVPRPKTIHFSKCRAGARRNCVVDGDTFYLNGEKIRVADIDTPETHPARCSYEAKLGARATQRFTTLLNNGPFTVKSISGRNKDRYGRKLRTLHRGGQSLGSILVAEGLARKWQGRRLPWCT